MYVALKEEVIMPLRTGTPGKYLTHLNATGDNGGYPDFEEWYQAVRYGQGSGAPATLQEPSEMRYMDIPDATRVFNQRQNKPKSML